MAQVLPTPESPDLGLSALEKMVAEVVGYYLVNGGPVVARTEIMKLASVFSYSDEWPRAFRAAMARIGTFEKDERKRAEEQAVPQVPPLSKEKSQPDLSDGHICHCLERLMAEKWRSGKPLFSQQSHWQAVFRILSDFGKFADDDFDGFDCWVLRVVPPGLRQLYSKQSVKNISQTLFNKQFDKWVYDPELMKKRMPYDRMEQIARRFKELLEGQD